MNGTGGLDLQPRTQNLEAKNKTKKTQKIHQLHPQFIMEITDIDQVSNWSKCHPTIDYTTVCKPGQMKMIVARSVKGLLPSPGFLCSLRD